MKGLLILMILTTLFAADKDEREQRRQERQQQRQERRQERRAPDRQVQRQPQRQTQRGDFQKGIERTPTLQRQRREDRRAERPKVEAKPRRTEDFKNVSKNWQNNRQRSTDLSHHVRQNRHGSHDWFRDDFFNRHHRHGFHHGGANWWRGSYWDNLAPWLPWGWTYPIYYDYGGTPIVIQNYMAPEPVPAAAPVEEWMPLGVFAAGRSEQEIAFSNFYIQLALNQSGGLSGTFYNSALDQTYPLVGQVDATSQQASWKLSEDTNSPIMVTGLYNLTQDIAPTEFYFPDGTVQSWTLVRLQEN